MGVFLNEKRINVCEHTVKMALLGHLDLERPVSQNISVKFPCDIFFFEPLTLRSLHIFDKDIPSYSYFCVFRTLVLSVST